VTDLWWTAAGLVFRTVPIEEFVGEYAGGAYAIYLAAPEGDPTRLYTQTADAPASPVGAATPATGAGDRTPTALATPGDA
jgi:hypothetical protein